ncbi:MAG: M4 family metallopeptidase [Flavobacteriales bacterium]|nr:M4 family metallopeptidase [Flavobacteriales bacterium]
MNRSLLILLCTFLGHFAFASEPDWQKLNINNIFGVPWSGEATPGTELDAQTFIAWYTSTWFPDAGIQFELLECKEDAIGMSHCRYKQTAHGYDVQHGLILLHLKNGLVQSFNGEIYTVESEPGIIPDYAEARNKFLQTYPANLERSFPDEADNLKPVYCRGDEAHAATLCYRFRTATADGSSDDIFFFDIVKNKIVRLEPQVIHTDSTGSATTFFRGRQTIVADHVGANSFRLKENKRPLNTYDAALGKYLTDTDNVWDTKGKEIAGDVHWGMGKLHDFMKQKFNWDSYANRKDSMSAVLNFSSGGNAFWNLSGNYATFLVNGSASVKPCAALDVVGHEFGHGIADENAGLVYSGESCMLHESFGDITGTLLERYVDSTKSNWLLGEEVWNGGIRNIQNPKAFKHPMTYLGSGWGGCHASGGVQNYWFYLMAMGDTGTNDKGLNYAIQGLGIEKATQIIFRAMFYYVTPNTTYPEMAAHTLKATKDLYGSCGPELKMTWEAWQAVGIEDTTVKLTDLSHGIVAPTLKCTDLPTEVHFRSKGDPSRKLWWDLGYPDTSNALDVRKTFTQYGNYTIFLMTEVCNRRFFDTLFLQINHQPEAAFDVNQRAFCLDNGDSLKAVSRTANPDKSQTLEHKWMLTPYQISGTGNNFTTPMNGKPYSFTLELTSYYKTGCSSTTQKEFEIHPVPKAKFEVKSTCEGLMIPLVNRTDTTRPFDFKWTLNDAVSKSYFTEFQPKLKADRSGKYTIELEIIDTATNCGSIQLDSFSIYGNPSPSFSVTNNCLGDTMRFQNTTQHDIGLNWFQWNFGVYRPFNKEEVALPVRDGNPWIVSLEALDLNGCKGKVYDTIEIVHIKSDFDLPLYCLNDPKAFINRSEGDQLEFNWDFGDGSVSAEKDPLHVYAESGNYLVRLTAKSPECSVHKMQEIRVEPAPNAEFDFSGICDGDTTRFILENADHRNDHAFFWQFGDGDTSIESQPSHFYQIDQSTTFSAQLHVRSKAGCSERVSKPVTVNSLPHCGFNWSYIGTERSVQFVADSTEYSQYQWDFGDGNSAQLADPLHKFADAENYTVKLKVTDGNGCLCEMEQVVRGMNLGISEFGSTQLSIYPNPANDRLHIKGDLSAYEHMFVIDPTGRILVNRKEVSTELDVSALPAGTFFLKLNGRSGGVTLPFVIGMGR